MTNRQAMKEAGQYLGLITNQAVAAYRRLVWPYWMDERDLVQEGFLRVVRALPLWELKKGDAPAHFTVERFLGKRLRWDFRDFNRVIWGRKGQKRKEYATDFVICSGEHLHGRESPGESRMSYIVTDPKSAEAAEQVDAADFAKVLLARLDRKMRMFVRRYYMGGETLKQIAADWPNRRGGSGCCESNLSIYERETVMPKLRRLAGQLAG